MTNYDNESIEDLFHFIPIKKTEFINPLVLAYIGDAVHQLYIRQYLLTQKKQKPHQLHQQAIAYVSAKAQAKALSQWLPMLTEEELGMVKRGRNVKSGHVPKNADVLDYRHSTAFECLIGYLYCKRQFTRLETLLRSTLEPRKERL